MYIVVVLALATATTDPLAATLRARFPGRNYFFHNDAFYDFKNTFYFIHIILLYVYVSMLPHRNACARVNWLLDFLVSVIINVTRREVVPP